MKPLPSTDGSLSLELITTLEEFDRLEETWEALYNTSPTARSTLHWGWIRQWLETFGPRCLAAPGGLKTIVWREGEKVVAIAPLYVRAVGRLQRKILQFISTGEDDNERCYPEYIDLLIHPEYVERVKESFASILLTTKGLGCDELYAGLVREDASVVEGFRRMRGAYRETRDHYAPHLSLSSSFDEYLQKLSSNARQLYRRMLRSADKEGVTLTLARSPIDAGHFLDELITLHQKRWTRDGQPGAFSSPRMREYHRALSSKLVPRGDAIIAHLAHEGAPLAVLYGFVSHGHFDFYQSGIADGTEQVKSPGVLAHLMLIRELCSRDLICYDLLAGESEYKRRLATGGTKLIEERVILPTVRSYLWLLGKAAKRSMRRLLKSRKTLRPG